MNEQRRQAVFFDRDGVLNKPIWNPSTADFESPHRIEDVLLYPSVLPALRSLQEQQLALFVVSNQPSYAKGKVGLDVLQAVATRVEARLRAGGVTLCASYYCYHHPAGVVPGFSGPCACRKPEPYFLFEAAREFGVDLSRSWMVGDRDTDVECGQRAGCRTILVLNPLSYRQQGQSHPNHTVSDVAEVAVVIGQDLLNRQQSLAWIEPHDALS